MPDHIRLAGNLRGGSGEDISRRLSARTCAISRLLWAAVVQQNCMKTSQHVCRTLQCSAPLACVRNKNETNSARHSKFRPAMSILDQSESMCVIIEQLYGSFTTSALTVSHRTVTLLANTQTS